MTNPERGEVTITLDGREKTLRPTFECLAEIERMTGKGVLSLLDDFAKRSVAISDVTAIVTAGLKAAGEREDYNKVGEMVLRTGLIGLLEPVGMLLIGAVSGGEAKNVDAPPKASSE